MIKYYFIQMLDVNYIRANPDKIRNLVNIGRASNDKVDIDKWLYLDTQRRELLVKLDEINRKRNELAQKGKQGVDIESLKEEGRKLKEESTQLNTQIEELTKQWQGILDWIPNIPYEEVPVGTTSNQNIEFKAWTPESSYLPAEKLSGAEGSAASMPKYAVNSTKNFTPRPHWEIGPALDIMDLEAGPKVSGSRFYYIKKEGALIIMAVFNLLMKKLLQDGFDPMLVPLLVKERVLYGSGHFPGDADQIYKLENKYVEDNSQLYLLGSSEPSNFAYFMDKILNFDELPVKVMAQTACFRSEVGSWGKDVRGIKRTHQFDKLEMNMIIEADDEKAREMHEYLLSINEWLLQELKLPYHIINMCTGDLGYYAAAKKYDVEVWLPSTAEYMEVMSDSITTDFQTRRLNIKYRDQEGNLKYPYTLNDTGATHRLLIAIIEHYQTENGDLNVPDVLRDFVGKNLVSKNRE
ncbi:seryl-tRNA synthetase [Candidatus Brocadiaceae bacterium]|nr:seryl-tRNA synthetase [Candidatus Brocadiaceae bacterium]